MISKFYRTPMLYLIAGAIGLCSLSACNFGGTNELYVRPINVTIPADASSVQALIGLTFEIIEDGDTTLVTFTGPNTIQLANAGFVLNGTVEYGPGSACTVTVDDSTFPVDVGPQAGDAVSFDPCLLTLETDESTQSGDPTDGTITLTFGDTDSEPEPVTVLIEDAGDGRVNIFVNGELWGVGDITAWGEIKNVTSPEDATGATGTGGTGGTGGVGGGS